MVLAIDPDSHDFSISKPAFRSGARRIEAGQRLREVSSYLELKSNPDSAGAPCNERVSGPVSTFWAANTEKLAPVEGI